MVRATPRDSRCRDLRAPGPRQDAAECGGAPLQTVRPGPAGQRTQPDAVHAAEPWPTLAPVQAPAPYLLASTSAARISGGLARSSSALAMSAAAMSPVMCAWRSASLPKVSKIQNVVAEVRAAYQATVPGSAS